MSLTQIVVIGGYGVLQLLIVVCCFSQRFLKKLQKKFSWKIITFCFLQMTGAFLVLLGGYWEAEESIKLYSQLRKWVDEYRYTSPEHPEITGDPGLLKFVQQQNPLLPRPDFEDVDAFRSWQISLRNSLYALFNFQKSELPEPIQSHTISSYPSVHGVTRIFLTYQSYDGTSIPAYLFLPPSKKPQPAIIVLPGHVGIYEEGISQTAGLIDSYQHKAALILAQAGFVTMTIEFRGFGYLGPYVNTEHKLVAHNAILGGSFYKAILCQDIQYAFHYLCHLQKVDSQRIGITGVSYGGEMAVTYAALDDRVKVIVAQGFGGSMGQETGVFGTTTEQPHYCHTIPGQNTFLLQEDWYFLLAPRPVLGIRGNREHAVAPKFEEQIRQAYDVFGVSSQWKLSIEPGGHEYFVWPAIQFFRHYL